MDTNTNDDYTEPLRVEDIHLMDVDFRTVVPSDEYFLDNKSI